MTTTMGIYVMKITRLYSGENKVRVSHFHVLYNRICSKPHGLPGIDAARVGGLYSNLGRTLEIATPGASLSTPWNGPCYNTVNVRSGCSHVQEPPALEDGSLLPLGQTPAGHAELPVNLRQLMRNQIRFICSLAGLEDVELF